MIDPESVERLAEASERLSAREELLRLLRADEDKRRQGRGGLIVRKESGVTSSVLSFAQERLWFLDQLELTGAAYNVPIARRVQGLLDEDALKRSFAELIARHESLRTRFETRDGVPCQVIDAAGGEYFERCDLTELEPTQREQRLQELMQRERLHRFDLANGPLLRVVLVRLDAAEHVLLMTMHHIVSDGWSMGILARELSTLYAAYANGASSPLSPLPVQYADYAMWQRQWLQGEELERQLSYWRERLGGAPRVLQLPSDRVRPAVASYQGAVVSFELSKELSDRLRELAQREGVTLYMALLAAFQLLLSRYSGQDDVVVGSPIAGRMHQQTEGLIGFFVNTLVLRTDLSGTPSFRELLERVKEVALGAYAHQDLPFEKLVAELQPERDLSHQPLFQVMFALHNFPHEAMRLQGMSWTSMASEHRTAQFDLTLFMVERPEGLSGIFEYATTLFDRGTIERMVAHFRTLLDSVTGDPLGRVQSVPLLTMAERRKLLVEWNDTRKHPNSDRCIHELFEEQVVLNPDAIAAAFESERLSYTELNRRANQLAHYLRRQGIGPDSLVAICVERGIEMVTGLLGILKAGAAYVPMDPAYPMDRLEHMLKDAAPAVLLTQEQFRARLPATTASVISLDGDWAEIARQRTDNLAATDLGLSSRSLAYVIYTSGSTGLPKAVLVEHRGVVNLLMSIQRELCIDSVDRLLAVTTLSFDIAALEIYLPLQNGAQLVLASRDTAADAGQLIASINECSATVLQATPATWRLLLAGGWTGSPRLKALCGGEALSTELSTEIRKRVGSLWNVYGPTETTIWSSCRRIATDSENTLAVEPIGRPLANTRIYILDAYRQPVPIGVAGEIYIGGVGVARGYLNRPELTAQRFMADPFSNDPAARIYMTGDMGRFKADGVIEYLGRNDHQVKVRGFRIELGEIEAQLRRHELVVEAAVIVREMHGEKHLVAYLTTGALVPGVRELRAHLQCALPEYMVPNAFVILAEFPLTPNGKLDRNALPAPKVDSYAHQRYEMPRGEIETALVAIWQRLLHAERVGRHDNFFELGGNSLLATRVISRVREVLRCEVPLRALFEALTVCELAERIEIGLRSEHNSLLPSLTVQDRAQVLPLSFAQERLWILEQLELVGSAYDVPIARRLHGPLDVAALERCFAELMARHESLRTRFEARDGTPYQVIDAVSDAIGKQYFELCDLSGLELESREQRLQELLRRERLHRFDLATGPLFRVVVIRLDSIDHVLLMTMHHIVSDGWSMGVLVHELSVLYAAFLRGEQSSPLQPLSIQYADYAIWQRQWLQGEELERQLCYWRERLHGAPELLQLPTDQTRPTVASFRGALLGFELSKQLSVALRELAYREGATMFMVLLAAYQVLLSRYSGQVDVVVGSPIAGRTHQQTEGLIGFFVNMLVLRTDLSGAPSFQEVLKRVKEVALGAYTHQDLPFEKLVAELQPQRDLSRQPLFQVMFALQNFPQEQFQLPELTSRQLATQIEYVKLDLALYAFEDAERLAVSIVYATDLFDRPMVERFMDQFRVLLEGIVADPRCVIARLPLQLESTPRLSSSRQRRMVEGCLHELFADQAARTPHAVALLYEGGQLTYAELENRANQLAHHLVHLGVRRESIVGLCVRRSPEMVVALLGILKAGGAYLPLDCEYPRQRLEYMLTDAGAKLLVTQHELLERLPVQCVPHVYLDADWEKIDRQPRTAPHSNVCADNLAYVIYTSGSTGTPKGVAKVHAGLANYFHYLVETYGLTSADRFLNLTSISFDPSLRDIFGPLLIGAALVIPEDERARNPHALASLVAENAITVISSVVPSYAQEAATEIQRQGAGHALRLIFSCGERLQWPTVDAIRGLFGGQIQIVNQYGPTEVAMTAADFRLPLDDRTLRQIPIGQSAANTDLYVLDEWLEPVPDGVIGELYIGGENLARGYLHRPGLTVERFVANPFGDGQRLYRTGDRVRWRGDDTLEFIGRSDNQVKIRGYRIELGEVEFALLECPGVKQAVVQVRDDVEGEHRLVGYIVGMQAHLPTTNDLREQLQQRLPRYMVPAAFVFMSALPLTPNGKVDRAVLPAPGQRVQGSEYVAPRTPLEKALALIWIEILGVERAGLGDNFFELGGHSLLATRMISRVRGTLGRAVTLRALFEAPTLKLLAQRVDAASSVVSHRELSRPLDELFDTGVL